jgi:hypothetical protein
VPGPCMKAHVASPPCTWGPPPIHTHTVVLFRPQCTPLPLAPPPPPRIHPHAGVALRPLHALPLLRRLHALCLHLPRLLQVAGGHARVLEDDRLAARSR